MEQTCTVHVQHCQRLKTFLYKPITDLKKTANLTASTLLRVSATACPSSKLLSLYLLATGSNFNTTRQILTFVNRNCSVSLTQDADKVSNLSRIDLSPNRIWLKNSFSFFKVYKLASILSPHFNRTCLFHLILKWMVNETQTDDAQLLSDLVWIWCSACLAPGS